jgi:DNA-directed RNA polymerase specialized sigma24 family protein
MSKRKGRMPDAQDPETLEGLMSKGAQEAMRGQGGAGTGLDLDKALRRLPEEYRSVVLLVDLENFTMSEAARIMECPVGTVKSRLFRARALLRDELRDYLPV